LIGSPSRTHSPVVTAVTVRCGVGVPQRGRCVERGGRRVGEADVVSGPPNLRVSVAGGVMPRCHAGSRVRRRPRARSGRRPGPGRPVPSPDGGGGV